MSDMIKLNELTQTYNLSNSDLLHVNKNGRDFKLDFEWLMRNVESSIGKDEAKWNASHLEGIDVSITDITPLDVLIFENNANANSFVNRRLVYTDIDYSPLTDSSTNRYLKIVNDQLITEEILITEVIPSSPNQRGKYLRVSDDGLNIVESDLNLSQFMVSPGSIISNMNTVASGISTIGEVTMNKPNPEMEGYVISARASSITTATAQIIIDYKSYETYLRTHDGVSSNQNDFGSWYHIFNNKTHPLSNEFVLNSDFNIATSKAVHDARLDVMAYIDSGLSSSSDSFEAALQQLSSVTIAAGTGLSGGGNLTANRTLSVKYGTTAGTAAQGNDSRIVNSVQTSGNQTIAGVKTFSTFPTTPSAAPTANYQAANKKYVDDKIAGTIPKGTKMLFQQTNAPTGWVKDTTHDNKALRVVTGTAGSGGSNAFSTAFNSSIATSSGGVHSHTVTVNNHTLTVAQLPSHSHPVRSVATATGGSNGGFYNSSSFGSNKSTLATGGGEAHNHSASSASAGAHTHTLNLNVQYVDLIIATKQ